MFKLSNYQQSAVFNTLNGLMCSGHELESSLYVEIIFHVSLIYLACITTICWKFQPDNFTCTAILQTG